MAAPDMQRQLVAQLDVLLREFDDLKGRGYPRIDLPPGDVEGFEMRARAAIHRVAGIPSVYIDQCEETISKIKPRWRAPDLIGIIWALRSDMEAGYLKSHTELIHGTLFADFLEMAQHLLDHGGYKDAAAVIAGSSLEAHVRQLCQKSGIDPATAAGTYKKADLLNSELAKAGVYSKLDQKNVTAWLHLRNKAAHGQYDQYEAGQVRLLIDSVRDFITRHPA